MTPSIAAALVIRFSDMEDYRNSRLGQYVGKDMASKIHGLRLAGQIIAWSEPGTNHSSTRGRLPGHPSRMGMWQNLAKV